MYIISSDRNRIINTDCVQHIGYEKCCESDKPYKVYAYFGSKDCDKCLISSLPNESYAQYAIECIIARLEKSEDVMRTDFEQNFENILFFKKLKEDPT